MRRPAFSKNFGAWCVILGLAVLLFGAGPGWAETLKVAQPNQQLYPSPDFAGTPIGPVPVDAAVNVIQQQGDWFKVDYQGKEGWLPKIAFPQAESSKLSLPGLLFGGPVKETKSDEVALAGKGFTPEVESNYRQKHPEMKFAQVDQIEGLRVESGKLQTFIKEGGLNP